MESVEIMVLHGLVIAFLTAAVVMDFARQRLPNLYLLAGLLTGMAVQAWFSGFSGLVDAGVGAVSGLLLLLPLYALRGMAAGDVKLMAAVGSFLGWPAVVWAAAMSVIMGGALGFLYLLFKGSARDFVLRYWLLLTSQTYVPAAEGDAARDRLPYAVAIALGTLISLYWRPFG